MVDRGTNLASKYMVDQLHNHQSQVFLIPTGDPWIIGQNERSHRHIHNLLDKSLSQNPSITITILIAEPQMFWNFTQHSYLEIPHLCIFGVLPCILGSRSDLKRKQRIALMELKRVETDHIRTIQLFAPIFNSYHRYDISLQRFTPNQLVWFHCRKNGWSKGNVTSVDLPTVNVKLGNRKHRTQENQVRTYFEEYDISQESFLTTRILLNFQTMIFKSTQN